MAGVAANAVALVALLSILVQSARSAVDYDTSVARSYTYGPSSWIAAKATWYGRPSGAGPEDNGTLIYMRWRGWRRLNVFASGSNNNASRSIYLQVVLAASRT